MITSAQFLIAFQIFFAWIAADFLTGLVHWFEDKYMSNHSLNFLNSIAEENDLHHRKPTAMLVSTPWVNMRSGAAIGWPVAGLFWLAGLPLWLVLVPFFASFGNLVHRFAHTPKQQLPRVIRGLQEFGVFISHGHHEQHHRSMAKLIPKHLAGFKYCPMSDWVNPVLDRIKFWTFLESVLRKFGLKTTAETS